MTGQLLGAYLTGGFVGILIAGIVATFVADHIAHASGDTPATDDAVTARLTPVTVHDLPRRTATSHSRGWTA